MLHGVAFETSKYEVESIFEHGFGIELSVQLSNWTQFATERFTFTKKQTQ